jgi:hypothetical protein
MNTVDAPSLVPTSFTANRFGARIPWSLAFD